VVEVPKPSFSPISGGAMWGSVIRDTFQLEAAHGIAEQTVRNISPNQYGEIEIHYDMISPGFGGAETGKIITVRLYEKIDGTNLRQIDDFQYTIGTTVSSPVLRGYVTRGTNTARLTMQASVAMTADYNIPLDIIEGGV
jgi:hypothetical protein